MMRGLTYEGQAAAVKTNAHLAAKAEHDAGRTVYAPRLSAPGLPLSARNLFGLAVEGIVDAGWRLVEWSVVGSDAYPVFVKADR